MNSILQELGSKPSVSEERGIAQLRDSDLVIFSPGISTAGFAEIRMAQDNPQRKIIATTIDKKGLAFAEEVIAQTDVAAQIETRYEDLRNGQYPDNYFDSIYARLVLHYLSCEDLDAVLSRFYASMKPNGRLFVVVRSVKNADYDHPDVTFDPDTNLTTITYRKSDGTVEGQSIRYFHTPESICGHLQKAGFSIDVLSEYQERLYKDFMRQEISPKEDFVIEVVAKKE